MNIIMEEKEKIKNVKLALVCVNKKLKTKAKLQTALHEVRDMVNNKIGDVSDLEDDINFIELLCNYVENLTKIKLKSNEKESIVIQLLTEYFPNMNNEKDIKRLKKVIENICEKGLVKISNSKVLRYSFLGFLKKMLFN